jgi:hypothetical protein
MAPRLLRHQRFPAYFIPDTRRHILRDRHMREQGVLLKKVSARLFWGLRFIAGAAVVKDTAVSERCGLHRLLDACDAFERQALAAAGGAEQRQDLVPGAK